MYVLKSSQLTGQLLLSKIKKPVKSSKKPANEQVQRQFLKTSKKPVMYQCKV